MFKCSICGKEFEKIEEYAADVAKCAANVKHKREEERKAALNAEKEARLAEVREAEERFYDLCKKYKRDYGETLYSSRSPFELFFNL